MDLKQLSNDDLLELFNTLKEVIANLEATKEGLTKND